MNNFLTIPASAALLSGLFLISACSSSDDGGGTTTASVPANATVIDASNAEAMIAAMSSSLNSFDQALSVETTTIIGAAEVIDMVKPRMTSGSNSSGIDVATGTAFSDSGACTVSGTYSVSGDETYTDTGYSETVTAIFNSCDDGFGFVIDGNLSGTFTEDYISGNYSDSVKGSMSIILTEGADSVKISFTGLDFAETGNNQTYTYTTSKATFALVVVVNGTTQAGFLTSLSAPIVESNGQYCPESGHITITGANGTTAEGIYNGDGTMTIKANGELVRTTTTCYT